jgi:hypothetical protein
MQCFLAEWSEIKAMFISDRSRMRIAAFSSDSIIVNIDGKLCGGKGGFGKLLKSQKNIGKKTDNFDSCRDLSGRRMRIANKEEKVKKLKEQKEIENNRVSVELAEKAAQPKITLDEKYITQLAEMERSKVNAVMEGINSVKSQPFVDRKNIKTKELKKLAFFDDDSD